MSKKIMFLQLHAWPTEANESLLQFIFLSDGSVGMDCRESSYRRIALNPVLLRANAIFGHSKVIQSVVHHLVPTEILHVINSHECTVVTGEAL